MSFLLQESADFLLLETGDKILLEQVLESSSVSPSLSPSASQSPSASSSRSVSPSASKSPSASSSLSVSPSASVSPSSSASASVSPSSSNSPSPSVGFADYTRQSVGALPTTDNDLSTPYSGQDLTDVSSINAVYVAQEGTTGYVIHQFKNFVGNITFCMLQFSGKADFSPASSPVLLQIFNQQTDAWETVATQNTVGAGADFTFDEYIADLTDYKTPENTISCRVWQELG